MSNTPLVKDTISISSESQDLCESSPKPQKRGPGRKRLPEGPKDAGGWRYRIRTDLLAKQDGCCADCHRKEKLQLHKLCKGSDFTKASNYVLLCADCIRKKKEDPKTERGWRYRIKKALQEKQGRKYRDLYACPGCLERKKLRLYRVDKTNDPPKESDYVLLCDGCVGKRIAKRQEEEKKNKLWTRGPGIKGGSPEASRINFFIQIRPLVFARDGRACVWCGAKEKLGLGPLTPPSRGGELCFDNYVVTCQGCRAAKGGKLPLEYIWGEITLDYWLHEQLDDGVTVKNPGARAKVNMHLVAEIQQYLHRIAAGVEIDRSKAERLSIKLSQSDEDRKREREQVLW